MKLHEVPHIYKLPPAMRKHLWNYLKKKPLGRRVTSEEREANIALRILAKSESAIESVASDAIEWRMSSSGIEFTTLTRRYPSSDMGILFQVFDKPEYQPALEILKKSKSGDQPVRILDAGANVGFASLYFKSAFPNASILSLEIDDGNFAQLKKNTEQGIYSTIHCLRKALWKKTAYLEIKTDFRDQSECSFYVEETDKNTGLEGHDLGHFLKLMNWDFIDFLKIDIEGGERYLFETSEQADYILSKTNLLAIEIHDEFDIRRKITESFKRNGFAHFETGDLTIAHRS